jgi:uncharacterized protein YgbK (DUF1537 family)
MDKILIPILAIAIVVVIGLVGFFLLTSSGVLDTMQLQAEADRANARAEQLAAEAELTEEQAELETAKGERILKESQAEVMEGNSKTVNGLMAFWGIVGSAIPPITFAVGLVVGSIAGGAIMYAVGLRNQLTRMRVVESNAPESPFTGGL